MNPPNDHASRRSRRRGQQASQPPAPPVQEDPRHVADTTDRAMEAEATYSDEPHAPGQSASTAYARSVQTMPAPPANGLAVRSAVSAPEAPGIIGSRTAARIEDEPRAFLRLTVMFDDRRGDLLLPGNVPLAELLPSLVKRFTPMTPRSVTRGYVLIGVDGSALSPGRTLFDLGIDDGAVLTLASRVKEREKKYDDIVEAVADAAAEMNKPWTPAHTAHTAVGATVVLVFASLLMLFVMRDEAGMMIPIATGTIAVLHGGLAWVLHRAGRSWHALIIAMLASVAAGVTGFAMTDDPLTELPAVFGGLSAMLVAGVMMLLLREWRELLMVPLLVGAVMSMIGGLHIALGLDIPALAVIVAALTGVAMLAVPQAAMRMSGLERTRDEVRAGETRKLYTRGHRLMVGFWVSAALILVIVALPAVRAGLYGAAVMILCTALLVLSTRRSYARADVLVQYAGALAIFVALCVAMLVAHPDRWVLVIVAMLLVIVATSAFGLVLGRTWTWMRRAADIAEILAIVLLIPAAVLALELW